MDIQFLTTLPGGIQKQKLTKSKKKDVEIKKSKK